MGTYDSLISTSSIPNEIENKYEIFPVPAKDIINIKILKNSFILKY